jgi:trigger factor
MIEITVEVPQSEMAGFWDLAGQKLAETLTVKGFRPGKIPRDIVEKTVGTEKFFNKAVELASEKTYREIVKENNLEPVGPPEITVLKISPADDFSYKLKVAVLPEVVLPDYKILVKSMAPRPQKVEQKEIEDALKWLRFSRAKISEVPRPAKNGDLVEIDLEMRLAGVKMENGSSKNQPLILGESRFVPGLEENLVGMKTGEEKEFSLKIPDKFREKNLAGKTVDFKVKMGPVKERELPEINDYFAHSLGNFEGLAALEKSIREGLLEEKETKEKEMFRMEMADKIAGEIKWDLPDVLIEAEARKMIHELSADIESRGLKFDDYLAQIKKNVPELEREFGEPARRRVKIALVLRAIAKAEKIEPKTEEVEEKMNEVLKMYLDVKTAEKDANLSELYERMSGILANEKVFEHLESLTKK